MRGIFLMAFLAFIFQVSDVHPCTSYLVTKGASADGSTMISYAGDSHVRYGTLYFFPRATWPEGSMLTIYDRSSGRPLGQIPQPRETHQVIGFMNEHQVSIGESTFGGRSELEDTTGLIDWGSIMFLGLQRARTAREAIKVMTELVEKHGYFSSGQSYSVADPNEAWIFEIIGKGNEMKYDKKSKTSANALRGAVWVAIRIPDGYISAHANHARITTFPLENGKTSISSKNMDQLFQPDVEVVYAYDVVDFARAKGYYSGDGSDFSFSDAYAPLDFGAARFCELRVWAMFDQAASGMDQYWDYATGRTKSPRMPLYIKPDRKLTARDLMTFKRNTLEGTDLDMSKDFGAGLQGLPYRWRPLTWKYEDKTYFNERVTATQQSAFSWVAQMRHWLPDPIGGIFWYGLDDAGLSMHAPFYCGMTHVPHAYAEETADLLTYSDESAFWVFNRVSHFIYLFYDRAIVDVRKKQAELGKQFDAFIPAIDAGATLLYKQDPELAREFVTAFSHNTADNLLDQWRELGNFLLVKYLDGNVKQEQDGVFQRNPWGFPASPKHPDFPDSWKKRLIEETGDKFLVPAK
ncbi:MAG: C69 family dipeptidase [Bacteroidales bacterium]